jgi:hypothetical protein
MRVNLEEFIFHLKFVLEAPIKALSQFPSFSRNTEIGNALKESPDNKSGHLRRLLYLIWGVCILLRV